MITRRVLLAIAAIVLVLRLPGFLVIHVGRAFIHILIVIAMIVVSSRRSGTWVSGLTRSCAQRICAFHGWSSEGIRGRRGRLLGDNAVVPGLGCG